MGLRRPGALCFLVALMVAMLAGAGLAAAPAYPALTGRVVDGANLLPPASRSALEGKLDALEQKSSIQLVVATVASLDGQEIEPYANGLFRFWKLGEAKANNGVLLLVAPNERRVRIEVGYGLEGTLTDALSKIIIANAMAPRFKAGDFAGGIERGTDDIITVLSTDTSDWQKRPEFRSPQDNAGQIDGMTIAIWVIVALFVLFYLSRQARGGRGGGIVMLPPGGFGGGFGGGGGGGFGGGGGGGGGFSGGGGSSGGGGASGGW